jgi:hypothetical protein
LTSHFLDVVTSFLSIMVMLSRMEDRKVIAGAYAMAFEFLSRTQTYEAAAPHRALPSDSSAAWAGEPIENHTSHVWRS